MTGFTLGMVAGALWLLFFVALGLTAHNSPGHPFRSIRKFRSTRRSLVEMSSTGEAVMDTQHSRGPQAPGYDVDSFLKRYRSSVNSREDEKTGSRRASPGAAPATPTEDKSGKRVSFVSKLLPWRKTTGLVAEPIKTTARSTPPMKRTKPPADRPGRFIPPYNYLRPSGYTIPTPSETETLVPTIPWTRSLVEEVSEPPRPPASLENEREDKMSSLHPGISLRDPTAWPFTEDEAAFVDEADEADEDTDRLELSEDDEPDDSFAWRGSAMGLRTLLEEHADRKDEQVEPERPGMEVEDSSTQGSDHFKAAMDLLARVAKEVEELESMTEHPEDRILELEDEPLGDESLEEPSETAPKFMTDEVEETSTPHAAFDTNGAPSEMEADGANAEPDSAPLETSSFETSLGISQATENGGSAMVSGAEPAQDDLDAAAAFEDRPAVWTYEGVSYFLVDDKGRPVLG